MSQIQRTGDFRIFVMHSLDLASAVSPEAARRVLLTRAHREPVLKPIADESNLLWSHGVASYTEATQDVAAVIRRQHLAYEKFNKTVLTPAFVEQVRPEVYSEPLGAALSTGISHIRVGEVGRLAQLIATGNRDLSITLRRSVLTMYDDGVAVCVIEFAGTGYPLSDFVSLVAALPAITQSAAAEKLSAVVEASGESLLPGMIQSLAQQDGGISGLLRRFGASHITVILQALCDNSGQALSHEDIRTDPGLVAVLRRTLASERYRPQEVSEISGHCLGYKSDELYATLRATTLLVTPGHWEPDDFLSLYVDDLLSLVSFVVSRISLVDFLSHHTHQTGILNARGDLSPNELVEEILLLRRLLLAVDESLASDVWINHYFTRSIIEQLQQERGLPNKLSALRRRVESLDGILAVMAQRELAGESLKAAVGQLRVAVIAVVITVVLSITSLVISLALS